MTASLILLLIFSLGSWIFLWYMMVRPQQWNTFVDKENDFWISKGMLSPTIGSNIKQFEKGLGMKVLVAIAALIGSVLCYLLWVGQ